MYKTVQTFIANRIYLFKVEQAPPVPVIFISWDDQTKNLANVLLYGAQGIAHTSCLFMPQTKSEYDLFAAAEAVKYDAEQKAKEVI